VGGSVKSEAYAVNVEEKLQQAAVAAEAVPTAAGGWLCAASGFKYDVVLLCWLALPTVLLTRVWQHKQYQQQQAGGYAQQVGGSVKSKAYAVNVEEQLL
jgi:hypothetical protein